MNSYLVTFATGASVEVEADFYEREGDEWVFTAGAREVLRVDAREATSITKAR